MINKVISLCEKEAFKYLKNRGITRIKSRSERYCVWFKNSIFNQNEAIINIYQNNDKILGVQGRTIHHNKKLITDAGAYILKEYRNLKLYNDFSKYSFNKYDKYNYDYLIAVTNVKVYNKLTKKYNFYEVSMNDLPNEYFKLHIPDYKTKFLFKKHSNV